MTDYFAVLDEPRRPWLDPEALKKKFLTLSGAVHPDRVHHEGEEQKRAAQARYTELNRAYHQLLSPKERLQHFLELETGGRPLQVQQVPAELIDLFVEVSQLFKQADAFLAQKSSLSSPLLQAQLFESTHEWIEKLGGMRQRLETWQQRLCAQLKEYDARWIGQTGEQNHKSGLLSRLEELYRLFSYCARWQSQLQDKIVQLSL